MTRSTEEELPLSLGGALLLTHFVDEDEVSELTGRLLSEFETDQRAIVLFGRPVLQPRLVGWASDLPYRYSGVTLEPRPMGETTRALLGRVNGRLASAAPEAPPFNHILLNYYRHERDSMGMHADDEAELGDEPWVGSLSLGQERTFVVSRKKRFRSDSPETLRVALPSGTLLLMRPPMQRYYVHGLPKSTRAMQPRLNLTFRHIDPSRASEISAEPNSAAP